MEHVTGFLRRGQIVKADGLARLQIDIRVKDGIGAVDRLIGGLQAGFAVFLRENKGPGIFVIGFAAVGDVQPAVQNRADLFGAGHGHGGLHIGHQLTEGAVERLGVVFPGEAVEQALEGPQAGDAADLDQADHTVAVHDDGGGVAGDAESIGPGAGATGHGQLQAVHGLEGPDGGSILKGIQGDDAHAVAAALPGLLHIGKFRHAVGAGGIPEVDQHHILLCQHTGEGHGGAVGGLDGEIIHDIAGGQGGTGQAFPGDRGRGDPDVRGGAGEGIAGLRQVSPGQAGNRDGITVIFRQGKGGAAAFVGGAVGYHVRQGTVRIDIDVRAGQGQTALGMQGQGIGGLRRGSSGFRGQFFLDAAGEQQCQEQNREKNAFHMGHTGGLFRNLLELSYHGRFSVSTDGPERKKARSLRTGLMTREGK